MFLLYNFYFTKCPVLLENYTYKLLPQARIFLEKNPGHICRDN